MSKHEFNRTFEIFGHKCEMLAERNEFNDENPASSKPLKFIRTLDGLRLVSENYCKRIPVNLRSHGAYIRERHRQMKDFPWTIHPCSKFRVWWNIFMIFACLFELVTAAIALSYYYFINVASFLQTTAWKTIRWISLSVGYIDIFLNFQTGYYDPLNKEIVLSKKKIASYYFKHMFFIDLLSSLPMRWELIFNLLHDTTMFTIVKYLTLIKFLRYFRLVKYYSKTADMFNMRLLLRQTILIVVSVVLYWHFTSCFSLFNSIVQGQADRLRNSPDVTFFKVFSGSMLEGAWLLKGPISLSDTYTEYIFYIIVVFTWFLAKLIEINFLGLVLDIIRGFSSSKQQYIEMVKQLKQYMHHKKLPYYMRRRILTYYDYRFQQYYFKENKIFDTISAQLKQEIIMHTCRQLVENVVFFRNLPLNLLARIISVLHSEIYLTNDIIIKSNTPGNEMYFIAAGTVAVITDSGKEICHLEDGEHFGEIALVIPDQLRIATVIAVETCELYRLDRNDFVKAINPYPDLMNKIERIAADRLEKTTTLDEHYRRQLEAETGII